MQHHGRMTSRRSARAIVVAALAVPTALVLAACTGGSGDSPTRTPGATSTTGTIGTPVTERCAELLPPSALAVYGQRFELDADATPAAHSAAATIAQQRGRVCVFRQVGDRSVTITLAVAHLPEKSLTTLKDALFERGGSVPTYTVEGYFALEDGVGRADAFPDPYWITASSSLFTEPGSAQPVLDAARQAVAPEASAPSTPSATPAG
jgi:hypothetical protein